jgi:hypothetical protein
MPGARSRLSRFAGRFAICGTHYAFSQHIVSGRYTLVREPHSPSLRGAPSSTNVRTRPTRAWTRDRSPNRAMDAPQHAQPEGSRRTRVYGRRPGACGALAGCADLAADTQNVRRPISSIQATIAVQNSACGANTFHMLPNVAPPESSVTHDLLPRERGLRTPLPRSLQPRRFAPACRRSALSTIVGRARTHNTPRLTLAAQSTIQNPDTGLQGKTADDAQTGRYYRPLPPGP